MARVKGTEQVIRNLSRIKKDMLNKVVRACQITQAKVVNDARSTAPVFITTLRQSILPGPIDVTDFNVKAYVTANVDYASYVEFGTRPHFPPVAAMRPWAEKKLGDPDLAFVIARAISIHGTRPHPFMGPALLKNQSTFRREVARALKQ